MFDRTPDPSVGRQLSQSLRIGAGGSDLFVSTCVARLLANVLNSRTLNGFHQLFGTWAISPKILIADLVNTIRVCQSSAENIAVSPYYECLMRITSAKGPSYTPQLQSTLSEAFQDLFLLACNGLARTVKFCGKRSLGECNSDVYLASPLYDLLGMTYNLVGKSESCDSTVIAQSDLVDSLMALIYLYEAGDSWITPSTVFDVLARVGQRCPRLVSDKILTAIRMGDCTVDNGYYLGLLLSDLNSSIGASQLLVLCRPWNLRSIDFSRALLPGRAWSILVESFPSWTCP
jgi:hypothetical protein